MLKSLWHVLPRRRAKSPSALAPQVEDATPGARVVPSGVDRVRGRGAVVLEGVTKTIGLRPRQTEVLKGVDAIFPRGRAIGVLGEAGVGKSTLVQILTGNMAPDAGRVIHGMRVSWPLGARDIFRKDMTIRANVRLLSLMYGAWAPDMLEAVKEIGKIRTQDMDRPLAELVPDFTVRASTSLCYALDFDCYVADDQLCAGSRQFRDHIKTLILERQKTHSLIIVSKNAAAIRDLCDDFYVLENGIIKTYKNRREAYKVFTGVSLTARVDPRGEASDDAL
ncbi:MULTISPECIES: ATP-binding cassette domain-containing protein [unclassified Xanthobacter]|uniref:ATP-binding cassette domain-containing protein n=1 Tax=unclassified Xanthobacter TaxID=2623496 RepID=UPI001F2F9D28|nr:MULTISPECIES: ATP-binding cassette domain-containing protein [unclassified Xanthobacter]